MDNKIYIEKTFLSENQLIDKHIRIRTLNTLSDKLNDLEKQITTNELNAQASTIRSLIEDAYNIDMYKFQFNSFTIALTEEIKILGDNISATK